MTDPTPPDVPVEEPKVVATADKATGTDGKLAKARPRAQGRRGRPTPHRAR